MAPPVTGQSHNRVEESNVRVRLESMSLLRFLGIKDEAKPPQGAARASSADTETVRKIVQQLEQLPPDRARYIAAFAYLLGRAARADLDISAEETAVMERIVMNEGGLPEEQAVLVVQIAKTQTRLFGGTENFLVTREFERIATREQKLALLECLFAVTAADEKITTTEDNAVRQIASELKLDHEDFITARLRFKQYLTFLKR